MNLTLHELAITRASIAHMIDYVRENMFIVGEDSINQRWESHMVDLQRVVTKIDEEMTLLTSKVRHTSQQLLAESPISQAKETRQQYYEEYLSRKRSQKGTTT